MKGMKLSALLLSATMIFSGCNMSNLGKGGLIGSTSGGALGALVGALIAKDGNKGKGAAIGAAVGVAVGKIHNTGLVENVHVKNLKKKQLIQELKSTKINHVQMKN